MIVVQGPCRRSTGGGAEAADAAGHAAGAAAVNARSVLPLHPGTAGGTGSWGCRVVVIKRTAAAAEGNAICQLLQLLLHGLQLVYPAV